MGSLIANPNRVRTATRGLKEYLKMGSYLSSYSNDDLIRRSSIIRIFSGQHFPQANAKTGRSLNKNSIAELRTYKHRRQTNTTYSSTLLGPPNTAYRTLSSQCCLYQLSTGIAQSLVGLNLIRSTNLPDTLMFQSLSTRRLEHFKSRCMIRLPWRYAMPLPEIQSVLSKRRGTYSNPKQTFSRVHVRFAR